MFTSKPLHTAPWHDSGTDPDNGAVNAALTVGSDRSVRQTGICQMADNYVGFVDAGVLRSLRKKYFRPQTRVFWEWFEGLSDTHLSGERPLRVYWYDAIHAPTHPDYPSQKRWFDTLGNAHGVQLRFGHLVAPPGVPMHQKGVDTLLTLDLVRHAGRADCSTAILLITDRDFVEAIRVAQDFGVRVLIATPNEHRIASELRQVVDGIIEIPRVVLREMLPPPPEKGTGGKGVPSPQR